MILIVTFILEEVFSFIDCKKNGYQPIANFPSYDQHALKTKVKTEGITGPSFWQKGEYTTTGMKEGGHVGPMIVKLLVMFLFALTHGYASSAVIHNCSTQ